MSDREGLKGTDYVFDLDEPPAWLPTFIRLWLLDLTFNELHAMELGLIGLILGPAAVHGFGIYVLYFLVASTAIAFGIRELPNEGRVAGRVTRKEPWYYVLPLLASTGVSYAVALFVAGI